MSSNHFNPGGYLPSIRRSSHHDPHRSGGLHLPPSDKPITDAAVIDQLKTKLPPELIENILTLISHNEMLGITDVPRTVPTASGGTAGGSVFVGRPGMRWPSTLAALQARENFHRIRSVGQPFRTEEKTIYVVAVILQLDERFECLGSAHGGFTLEVGLKLDTENVPTEPMWLEKELHWNEERTVIMAWARGERWERFFRDARRCNGVAVVVKEYGPGTLRVLFGSKARVAFYGY